jgi:hypothetical protein
MWLFQKKSVSGTFGRLTRNLKLSISEEINAISTVMSSGFGGQEVACWPMVPKFAGLHPAETIEF